MAVQFVSLLVGRMDGWLVVRCSSALLCLHLFVDVHDSAAKLVYILIKIEAKAFSLPLSCIESK